MFDCGDILFGLFGHARELPQHRIAVTDETQLSQTARMVAWRLIAIQ
jgi:hypothetical protein